MKKIVISAGLGVAVFGGLLYVAPFPNAPPAAAALDSLSPSYSHSSLDSTLLETMGVVGAGGDEPLLARTQGRVQNLFFSGGDYARPGQVLVKLSNHTFITAPRAGFLGSSQVAVGQHVLRNTLITNISRRSYLVVSVLLPHDWLDAIKPGDSARVWSTTLPTRMSTGMVGSFPLRPIDEHVLGQIILSPGAPFRIGEHVGIRLRDTRHPLVVRHSL